MWHTKSIQAKALLYTILFSAVSHLTITVFVAILTDSPDKANMFSILGVNLIWPSLGEGSLNSVLGGLTVVAIWVVIFSVMSYHVRHQKPEKKNRETTV